MDKPKFYINPLTSRMIKSTARTFKKLKKEQYVIDKHKCLYNVKSAERCFNKLLKLYPDIIYPSSNFIDIPKTYKRGSIRAFIGDKKKIKGYIDKTGKKYRLKKSIYKNKRVPIVKDLNDNLKYVVDKLPKVDDIQQKIVEDQIDYDKPIKHIDDINIIYNPLQNDFIPVNQKLTDQEIEDILESANRELIPNNLLPISKNFEFSGIIKDDENIYGLIDTSNQIKRLDKPIKIKEQKDTLKIKLETKSKESITQPSEEDKLETKPEGTIFNKILDTISDTISTISDNLNKSETESIPDKSETESIPESLLQTESQDSDILSLSEEPEPVKESEPVKEEAEPIKEEPESVKEAELVKEPEPVKEPESVKEAEREIEKEYIESLPEVKFIKSQDIKSMEETLVESPIIESEDVIKQIKCLDGSQWDINENRCISCDKYGLVWDAEYRSCKIMLKDTIKKIKTDDENDFIKIGLKVIVDNKDKILGYLE